MLEEAWLLSEAVFPMEILRLLFPKLQTNQRIFLRQGGVSPISQRNNSSKGSSRGDERARGAERQPRGDIAAERSRSAQVGTGAGDGGSASSPGSAGGSGIHRDPRLGQGVGRSAQLCPCRRGVGGKGPYWGAASFG